MARQASPVARVPRHPDLDDDKTNMGCLCVAPPEPRQPLAVGVDGSR